MSHIQCPKCYSREHYSMYGFGGGMGLGGYTVCECGLLLEFERDLEGMDWDELATLVRQLDSGILATIFPRKDVLDRLPLLEDGDWPSGDLLQWAGEA